jgi:hypothetical protein
MRARHIGHLMTPKEAKNQSSSSRWESTAAPHAKRSDIQLFALPGEQRLLDAPYITGGPIAPIASLCVLAAPAASERHGGVGPPPVLAPGQVLPLPKPGQLAQPRSQDQVGLPD